MNGRSVGMGTPRWAARALVMLTIAATGCESSTKPPATVGNVTIGPATGNVASLGTLQLAAVVTTAGGSVLEGRVITWNSGNTAMATVSPTGLVSGLRNLAGTATVVQITATVEGVVGTANIGVLPVAVADINITPPVGALAESDSPILTFSALDDIGNTLTGRIATWTSRDTTVLKVTPDGQLLPQPFIDSGNRSARIVAAIGTVRDSITVQVQPANITSITMLPTVPYVQQGWTKQMRIRGTSGSGAQINGLNATYTSSNPGIASITSGGLLTAGGSPGTTEVIATLGSLADTVTVTVDACGAAPAGTYPIELRVVGAALTPAVQQAFDCAVARIRAIIRTQGTLVGFSNSSAGAGCFNQTLNGTTDGLIIFVRVDTIDGPGAVLGRAGPCLIRSSNRLPVVGAMEFDDDDMASLEASGTLGAVIMHEMLHVIGIGTTWRDGTLNATLNVYTGDVANPGFLGQRARTACQTEHGGVNTCAVQVPIEDCIGIPGCGVGTIYGHWREGIFNTELMTGYVDPPRMPFARMTIEALGDLGYSVDPDQSNDYVMPSPSLMAGGRRPLGLRLPAPQLPTHTVDANGRTRPILR